MLSKHKLLYKNFTRIKSSKIGRKKEKLIESSDMQRQGSVLDFSQYQKKVLLYDTRT